MSGPALSARSEGTQDSKEQVLGQPHHHLLLKALLASPRGGSLLVLLVFLSPFSAFSCATWVCPLFALPGVFSFDFSLTALLQGKGHVRFIPSPLST